MKGLKIKERVKRGELSIEEALYELEAHFAASGEL